MPCSTEYCSVMMHRNCAVLRAHTLFSPRLWYSFSPLLRHSVLTHPSILCSLIPSTPCPSIQVLRAHPSKHSVLTHPSIPCSPILQAEAAATDLSGSASAELNQTNHNASWVCILCRQLQHGVLVYPPPMINIQGTL